VSPRSGGRADGLGDGATEKWAAPAQRLLCWRENRTRWTLTRSNLPPGLSAWPAEHERKAPRVPQRPRTAPASACRGLTAASLSLRALGATWTVGHPTIAVGRPGKDRVSCARRPRAQSARTGASPHGLPAQIPPQRGRPLLRQQTQCPLPPPRTLAVHESFGTRELAARVTRLQTLSIRRRSFRPSGPSVGTRGPGQARQVERQGSRPRGRRMLADYWTTPANWVAAVPARSMLRQVCAGLARAGSTLPVTRQCSETGSVSTSCCTRLGDED
jgi:hypothetical protein